MKVLFISIDGLSDPLGQSQIIPYLIVLSKKGYEITILSAEKPGRIVKQKELIELKLKEANIDWKYFVYTAVIPLVSQWVNINRLKREASNLYKNNAFHVIHCRSYLASLIGLWFKRKYSTGFIFDMRGFWANERIDGGIWKLSNPLHKWAYRYFKRKELEFIRAADCIVSLTENAKGEMQSWKETAGYRLNIRVVPCCVDMRHFSYEAITKDQTGRFRKELNITEQDFIVSYLGSLGTWYMLDEMLLFFKRLLLVKPEAKFLFITGDDEKDIRKRGAELGIEQEKLLIRSALRHEVPAMVCLSSIALFFIKPLYSKKASSPTKMAEILACGLPFITNTGIGDSDVIIKNTGSGMLVGGFNDKAYDKAIKDIDIYLQKEKAFYREVALRCFSLEEGVKVYEGIYSELAAKYRK